MIILIIIKVILGISMILWLACDELLLDIIKVRKFDDDMLNDDYHLTCLEKICVANSVHYLLGIGVLIIIALRIFFVESKMNVICIVFLFSIMVISIFKIKMINDLIYTSIAFDRIRDYQFICLKGWVLEAGECDFEFEEEEDKEIEKKWFKIGIRIVYKFLYIELGLFYFVVIFL